VGGAAKRIMLAGLLEAELAVHGEADFGGVLVLLAIVLPPADRAQRQGAGRIQRLVSAARAAKTKLQRYPTVNGRETGRGVYAKSGFGPERQLLAGSLRALCCFRLPLTGQIASVYDQAHS